MNKKLNFLRIFIVLVAFSISAKAQTKVKTAQEFVNSLKSNSTIELIAEKYVLSELKSSKNPNISFEDVYNSTGKEVHISNISNLIIDGSFNSNKAELMTEPTYGNVLVFENCKNITIKNIIAGHGPEKGQCLGGVLKFNNCYNVKVEKSILYGSGTYGITASNSEFLKCKDVYIKECTYGIIDFKNVKNFSFNECKFKRNEGFDMLNIEKSSGSFTLVEIESNNTEYGYLFNLKESKINAVSVFIESNKIKKGLCNDWDNFKEIDFFGFTVEGSVDAGLANYLNKKNTDNRLDLQKKWKLDYYQGYNSDKVYYPKKNLFLDFKSNGNIDITGDDIEKLGKFSWSPISEEHLYISNERGGNVIAFISKVYNNHDGKGSISMDFLLGDVATCSFKPAAANSSEKKTTIQNVVAEYKSAEALPEGEVQISFINKENGGYITFISNVQRLTATEKLFVNLTGGKISTVNSKKNKDFQIEYFETNYIDENTGGNMSIRTLANAVEIIYTEEEVAEDMVVVDELETEEVEIVIYDETEQNTSNSNETESGNKLKGDHAKVDDKIGNAVKNNNLAHYIRTNSSYQYINTEGKLTILKFDGKKLTNLPDDIAELSDLEEVDISNNNFTKLPDCVFKLSKLQVLKITNNNLKAFSSDLSKLQSLTAIYASKNNFTELQKVVCQLSNLRVLDFSNNKIRTIDNNISNLHKALYNLNLSQNELESIPESISGCYNLSNLNLGNNKLSKLPTSIGSLSKMKVLKLNDNQLTSLPSEISNMSDLRKLWIHNNNLSSIPASFKSLSKLKQLGKEKKYKRTKSEKKDTEAFIERATGLKLN